MRLRSLSENCSAGSISFPVQGAGLLVNLTAGVVNFATAIETVCQTKNCSTGPMLVNHIGNKQSQLVKY